ncbi:hypothetical protein K3495_g17202, partial [Podosphaera aphanis]
DVMALNPTRSNTTVLDDEQAYTSDTTTEREANLRVSTRINKGRLPKRFTLLATLLATASEGNEPFEPKTVKQAQNDERWSDWKEAMEDELRSLQQNKTWEIVNRPENRRVLRGKWVYKLKRGPNGEISRYKARWVVRGFEQEEGLDYNETFASVVKPMSYKSLFAIAAALDLECEQMDVKTAFLYGKIEE